MKMLFRVKNPETRTNVLLGAILLLAFALRLPGWFTQDEKTRFRLFEPDEYQHLEIAIYQIQCIDTSLLPEWDVERKIFNARGFGIQLGSLAWAAHRITGMALTGDNLIVLGRALSTIYALFLILLVYYLGLLLFGNRKMALTAALLMAICDLNITYSHYALPAISYVFWSYLLLALVLVFIKTLRKDPVPAFRKLLLYAAFMAWAAAAAFAAKFDFIPFFLVLLILVRLSVSGPFKWSTGLLLGLAFVVLFILWFALQTTFNFSLDKIVYSFRDLYRQNKDVLIRDNHWLTNPPVYLLGIIGGIGIPVAALSVFGGYRLWKNKMTRLPYFVTLILFLALEFGVRWSSDIPFIRRANIFMPALVLMAAFGWASIKQAGVRHLIGGLTMVYTLTFCLVSQANAWWDTRYAARDYLNQNFAGQRIKYGGYAFAIGMPPGVTLNAEEDILMIHETAYSRYWRSFTTPFRIPACCEEAYHCDETDCRFIQDLFSGKNTGYEIIKRFRTREIFPERILFKKYLGNFETFVGDVVVLEKTNPG